MSTKTRERKRIPKSPTEGLTDALKEQFPEAFAPEIINGTDVTEASIHVLLSVAYSPVIPDRHGIIPCEVTELDQDAPETAKKYRIYFPRGYPRGNGQPSVYTGQQDVTADELRVMRSRRSGSFRNSGPRM